MSEFLFEGEIFFSGKCNAPARAKIQIIREMYENLVCRTERASYKHRYFF